MAALTTIRSTMGRVPNPSMTTFVRTRLGARGLLPPAADDFADVGVPARVEHGRWIIDCPACPSAGVGDPDDARFYCLECGNERAGGRWLHVLYPVDLVALEVELLRRPVLNRNWVPGESVADLQLENAAYLGPEVP